MSDFDERGGMLTTQSCVTYQQYELAQARAEDWLIARGQFSRETVKEIMDMLAGPMLSPGGMS